jgi:hypothetical protein
MRVRSQGARMRCDGRVVLAQVFVRMRRSVGEQWRRRGHDERVGLEDHESHTIARWLVLEIRSRSGTHKNSTNWQLSPGLTVPLFTTH